MIGRRFIVCRICGETGRLQGRGMCGRCYGRWYWRHNPRLRQRVRTVDICVDCGRRVEIHGKGLCDRDFMRLKMRAPSYRRAQRESAARSRVLAAETLRDSWVRKLLTQNGSPLRAEDIPPALIEAKRAQLKIRRLTKAKTT